MTIKQILMWLYTTLSNYNLFVPDEHEHQGSNEEIGDAANNVKQQKYSTRIYVLLLISKSFHDSKPISQSKMSQKLIDEANSEVDPPFFLHDSSVTLHHLLRGLRHSTVRNRQSNKHHFISLRTASTRTWRNAFLLVYSAHGSLHELRLDHLLVPSCLFECLRQ